MSLKKTIKEWLRYCRSPEIIAAEEKQNIHEVTEAHFQALKAKWEENRFKRPEPTICKQCDYYRTRENVAVEFTFKCTSPEAPYTDFVTGHKDPQEINRTGKCKYFKKYEGQQPPFWRVI